MSIILDSKLARLSTKKDYESIEPLYRQDFEYYKDHFEVLDEFANLVKKNDGKKILDIGCGHGTVIWHLRPQGFDFTAVDFVHAHCEYVRKKYQIKVYEADIVGWLPEFSKSQPEIFDGITANFSLIHIPDDELAAVLKELADLLKERGYFVLSVYEGTEKKMELEPYQAEHDQRLNTSERLESYMNYFSLNELKGRLKRAGFSTIKTYRFEDRKAGEFQTAKLWIIAQKLNNL